MGAPRLICCARVPVRLCCCLFDGAQTDLARTSHVSRATAALSRQRVRAQRVAAAQERRQQVCCTVLFGKHATNTRRKDLLLWCRFDVTFTHTKHSTGVAELSQRDAVARWQARRLIDDAALWRAAQRTADGVAQRRATRRAARVARRCIFKRGRLGDA